MPRSFLVILVLTLSGCAGAGPEVGRSDVSSALESRVGSGLAAEEGAELVVRLDDGLDLREAGALALTANPDFLALLAELDVERARFIQAGLLTNPMLSVLFPLGPKQFETALFLSVDALWERPRRVEAARRDVEAVADDLVAHGLAAVRDAQLAFIDAVRSRAAAERSSEIAAVLARRLELEERRHEAGDVAATGVARSRFELERARALATRGRAAANEAMITLRGFLGIDTVEAECVLVLDLDVAPSPPLPSLEHARRVALASRPEIRAAEIRVEGAEARCRLAEVELAAVRIVGDANGSGDEGFEAGPGLEVELPIFDHGQGRRALARAELERAVLRRRAVEQRVFVELESSYVRARAAEATAASSAAAVAAARDLERQIRAGRLGGTHTDVDVLEAERAVLEERELLVQARAAAWTARVEAEYAIGRRLDSPGGP